jgi:acyl carrier protein
VNQAQPIDKETIRNDVIRILSDMTQEWDMGFSGPITGDSCLVAHLGFQSIDVVMLMSEIHRYYQGKKFPFELLFITKDGYVDDLRISVLVDFIHAHWNGSE